MPVTFGNKEYKTVAERLGVFFRDYAGYKINTHLVPGATDDQRVTFRAEIFDKEGEKVATGHACNERGADSFTGKDTEKCETTAVGRALAFLSEELMGSDIASADEVHGAIKEQTEKAIFADWAEFTQMVEIHHESLVAIREFLAEDNFDAARECWNEISNDDKQVLWRATTKGGWFTPRERSQMKWWSNDFEKSRKDV